MARLYTADHEWLEVSGDTVTVGITEHAQSQLGDLVFIDLPAIGRSVRRGESLVVVESVKAASDIYAPISGEIVAVNSSVALEPTLINVDPEGSAWLFRIRLSDIAELECLVDADTYQQSIA